MRYSVVVPVYNNEDTLARLVQGLSALADRQGGRVEVVFVVDGAPDNSLAVLERVLPTAGLPSQLLVHSRNFGSFPAIRAGLAAARGQYLGVMAADLQEPPELMERFFDAMENAHADVVVGRRESRQDPALSSALSRAFWRLYRRFVNRHIPPGGVDVFGCTREVAARLLALAEAHSSLVGLLFWVGYRRVEVPYHRIRRESGNSGWSMRRRVRYLMDSVFSFTDIPIQALQAIGFIGSLVTLMVGLAVLGFWAVGRITEPGYTPLMLTILFSTFSILGGLGVVGSYVWRTYENSKGRPNSIVMRHRTFDG